MAETRKRGKPKVSDAQREEELRQVVEAVGLWFEEAGVPRMAGRIAGWLLVCDPPEQTMQELAENLNASMGSISTMTRFLTQLGLVERTSQPGQRRVRYRIRPDAWSWHIEERVAHLQSFLTIADQALVSLKGSDPVRSERLNIINNAIRMYEGELTALVQRWKTHRAG